MESNQITFNHSGDAADEWIKITKEGFYVRGVRVPADEKEAVTVYNAFKEWLAWANMTRQ
jgi:hypothetical protein